MKEKLSPQQKKQLSYKKDHRTRTVDSNRAMRKSWAARKARVNRNYRRKTDAALCKAIGPDRIDALLEEGDTTTRELIRKGLTRERNYKSGVCSLGETLKLQAERRAESMGARKKRRAQVARGYMEEIVAVEQDPSSLKAQILLDRLRWHKASCQRSIFGDCHLHGFYAEYPRWKERLRAKLTQIEKAEWKANLKAEQKWKWRSPALRKPRPVKPEDVPHP